MIGGCAPLGGGGPRTWSGSTLAEADTVARSRGARGWAAWEHGTLRKSWRTHHRGPILSVTKALAGLACARAVGEGWLKLDQPASATLSEWSADPLKSRITVRMLLQMTAGLDEGGAELYNRGIGDKGRVAMGLPVLDEPGTRFRYGPVCWEVLAELLHRKAVARGETLERMIFRTVMGPLQLTTPKWRSDRRDRYYLSTGAELNITEMGRLGRAIASLASGQDVAGLTASAFRDVTRTSSANAMFGGGVWSNRRAPGRAIEVEDELDPPKSPGFWRSACLSRSQPSSMLALIGSSGQRVYIWPQQGRVVARLGYSGSWLDVPFLQVI